MTEKIPEPVDKAFRSLCTILFGREVGPLEKFAPYLKEAMLPYTLVPSHVSSKEVYLSSPLYNPSAKYATLEELPKVASNPLSINDVKDVDSLFRAASENMVYCGNKVFGKNFNAVMVDNAINCVDVYFAHIVRNVNKGAFISCVRESEYVFGVPAFPKIRYTMRSLEGINTSRAFETYYSTHVSDIYYSFNCSNCTDCIFGFNLRGKRNVIGNLQLSVEKYQELKKKLLSELADELEKNGRAFSISDLARMAEHADGEERVEIPTMSVPAQVEKAFKDTTRVVLGREHCELEKYAPWLMADALKVWAIKGRGGCKTYKVDLPLVRGLPDSCLCTMEEALKQDKPLLNEDGLSQPLKKVAEAIAQKAAFTLEMVDGVSANCSEVTQIIDSTECFSMWDATSSSKSGCSSAVIQSKYIFGGYFRMLDSEFCINCNDVVATKRSFSCDSCTNCTGCFYCHNCEGCEECIFCSNVKGMRYAVLNKEVGKLEYERIKKMLLDYINKELAQKKAVKQTVYKPVVE